MEAVIYARVSTEEQDTERQIEDLTKIANDDGYTIVKFFNDKITGASKAGNRRGFEEMLVFIKANNINQIYCWELSRLGRSLLNNLNIIQELRDQQINICIKKEGINTRNNDANSQLQLNILSSLAEYERHTIKARTMSGTYNSIRKGGTGGGNIKQFGYKKQNGKLVIDEEERAVILDIVDKYLNKDMSVKQIADYLNESGIETRIKKLVNGQIINYTRKCKLLWTDGSVARLLHKRLLTGYRKYGKVELQDEAFRILDDNTYNALQIKMESKRKVNTNAQKFENIFKGVLRCGNCGGTMVMQKSTSGLQNHYECYERFVNKSNCTAAMINIDLLNNQVYELAKDYKVDSKDVADKIAELEMQKKLNNSSINQINTDLNGLSAKEERLVELYIANNLKPEIYEKQLNAIREEESNSQERKAKLENANNKIQSEISELSNTKVVDLSNPIIFKSNIKRLVESIEVKTLSKNDLPRMPLKTIAFTTESGRTREDVGFTVLNNFEIAELEGNVSTMKVIQPNRRNKFYRLKIRMFDDRTVYNRIFNNAKPDSPYPVTVGLI